MGVPFLIAPWAAIGSCFYDFDGLNEYIDSGNDSSLDFTSSDPFSVSIWFNSNDVSLTKIMCGKRESVDFIGYTLLTSSSNIRLVLRGGGGSDAMFVDTSSSLNNDTWYNAIATYNGSFDASGVTIYLNGVSQPTILTLDSLTSTISNSDIFAIGQSHGFFWDGFLDEASVWNKELSSIEATAIFNKGRINVDYSDISNLISHWKMGENDTFSGSNWTVVDEQGTNTGISVNMDELNRRCE